MKELRRSQDSGIQPPTDVHNLPPDQRSSTGGGRGPAGRRSLLFFSRARGVWNTAQEQVGRITGSLRNGVKRITGPLRDGVERITGPLERATGSSYLIGRVYRHFRQDDQSEIVKALQSSIQEGLQRGDLSAQGLQALGYRPKDIIEALTVHMKRYLTDLGEKGAPHWQGSINDFLSIIGEMRQRALTHAASSDSSAVDNDIHELVNQARIWYIPEQILRPNSQAIAAGSSVEASDYVDRFFSSIEVIEALQRPIQEGLQRGDLSAQGLRRLGYRPEGIIEALSAYLARLIAARLSRLDSTTDPAYALHRDILTQSQGTFIKLRRESISYVVKEPTDDSGINREITNWIADAQAWYAGERRTS